MKRQILFLAIILLGYCNISYCQEFNKNIDKDSLFHFILKEIPEEMRGEFKKIYVEGNDQDKEFVLFMFSMPRSSKKELIENFENKSKQIEKLKKQYSKLVPDSLVVNIEFNPENKIISTPESIDLKIYRKYPNGRNSVVSQEWNLDRESDKLAEMLLLIGWDQKTLNKIKKLLDSANCVSIENSKNTSIGLARSGMGKYYYLVFDNNLTKSEIDNFNDGCLYIYYKDNIVLYYGSGATGSICFPDD